MEVKSQTLTIERRGLFNSEIVITGGQGEQWRLKRSAIEGPDGRRFKISVRGCCRRVHTLRAEDDSLSATAMPGARGYNVVARDGSRYWIGRKSEGWFKSAIVATRGGSTVLRFERKTVFAPQLANQSEPMAPEIAAFLVYLQQTIVNDEAAAVAAIAAC
jgi:hypothetical protein